MDPKKPFENLALRIEVLDGVRMRSGCCVITGQAVTWDTCILYQTRDSSLATAPL